MPYYKCSKCHHEWETVTYGFVYCTWCFQDDKSVNIGIMLEKETPLSRMLKSKSFKKMIREMCQI